MLQQPPTSDGSPNEGSSRAMSPAVVSGCLPERAHALCDLKEMDLVMQCCTKLEETEESHDKRRGSTTAANLHCPSYAIAAPLSSQ
ncbi:hypothetical protein PS2_030344 [Malus domestica]